MFFLLMIRRPPRSTRLPCTALFRSALKALSRREGATLFMTLLAAFQALLHRYTNRDDIVVGAPLANRNRRDRKSTRLNSSHANISYAVFCLKKKNNTHLITVFFPLT